MSNKEDNIEVTEMDVIEEAHLRIDALLVYMEKKGLGSVEEFESFYEEFLDELMDEEEE
ncbi:MAG: hypothetical protein LAT82_05015 [Nanoarchaeota archaeon]|nr:hypothetical protein [Nanoarchaeota archaeon]